MPANSRWISNSAPGAHAKGCTDVRQPGQCIACWKADISCVLATHQRHPGTRTPANASHPGLDSATREDVWPYGEAILVDTSRRHVGPGMRWVEIMDGVQHPTVHSSPENGVRLKMSAVSEDKHTKRHSSDSCHRRGSFFIKIIYEILTENLNSKATPVC